MEGSRLNGFDATVLGVGALVGAPTVIVWTGAGLSAAVTGRAFRASIADGFGAAASLPSHLGDPRWAWPKIVAESLPGPLLYWVCTALVAALVAIGVILAFRRWWGRPSVGTVKRDPLGVDGRARFATRRDLAPLIVQGAQPGRFGLGSVDGRTVATEDRRQGSARRDRRARGRVGDRGAVALIGPSRCGKTAAAVAGILDWDGPAILSSVKSDLLGATEGWRSRLGQVRVYDPTGSTGRACATWTPLRAADSVLGSQRAARSLCDAAPRGGVEGGLDFWLAQAEILLSGLLYVAHHSGRDMATVCEWVMTQDRPGDHGPGDLKTALDVLLDVSRDGGVDADVVAGAVVASRALVSVWEMEERTRSSIYATAQTVVWPWADPGVAQAARGRSIELDWLLSGSNTLYLCAPIEDQARLAPAFGGLLSDLIKQAYLRVAATNRPLDPPLLVVIDEAGNTPLRAMPEYASTLAGIGVLIVTIWQSLAQLEVTYRRHADTILTNHRSKVFYAGLTDTSSLRYVAQVLGDAEVDTRSRTTVAGDGKESLQRATTRVPLAPPHALREMRDGEALLIHGTLPPAHLRTHPYYQDPILAARAALDPVAVNVRRALVRGTAPHQRDAR